VAFLARQLQAEYGSTSRAAEPSSAEQPVMLLEAHKLMYFMRVAGQDLRLKYANAGHGLSENLRHVLNAIGGHLVAGYSDGGDAPDKRLSWC